VHPFEGCDFLHLNEDGSIDELAVMVRPLSGTLALADAMKLSSPPHRSSLRDCL
jgi:hypothetical protein